MNDIKELDIITIIIPTFNRYNFLKRLLTYYDSFNKKLNIFIADSSSISNNDKDLESLLNNKNINYLKFPSDISPTKKIFQSLKQIKSKYVVICADDDFIITKAIEKSVEFLEQNPDYSCTHGFYAQYTVKKENLDNMKIYWNISDYNKSIEFDNVAIRIQKHRDNCFFMYYAVQRKKQLYSVLNETIKSTSDYQFSELLSSILTIIYGKMKYLDTMYCVRRYDITSLGHTIKTMPDFIKEGTYNNKYKKFKECIVNHLIRESQLSLKDAEKLIDEIMKTCLINAYGSSMKMFIIKRTIKEKLKKFSIMKKIFNLYKFFKNKFIEPDLNYVPFDELNSKYYDDLTKINNIIKSFHI